MDKRDWISDIWGWWERMHGGATCVRMGVIRYPLMLFYDSVFSSLAW